MLVAIRIFRGFLTKFLKGWGTDIPERIQFRIAVTVHRCLNGFAPAYLTVYTVYLSAAEQIDRAVVCGCHIVIG